MLELTVFKRVQPLLEQLVHVLVIIRDQMNRRQTLFAEVSNEDFFAKSQKLK